MRKALVLSIAVHALGLVLARPVAHALELDQLAEPHDRWTGKTASLPSDTTAEIDVGVEPAHEAQAPAAVTPAAPSPPAPRTPLEAPEQRAPEQRAPTPVVTAAKGSETFRATREPKAQPPASDPPSHDESPGTAQASRATKAAPRAAKSGASGGESGPFGAEGPPSPRDIGYAFTRAIPPANDSDQTWASVAKGRVGRLEIALHIDETGHITSAEPQGTAKPAALVGLLKRTLPMLRAGTFEVRRGSVSEGTEILEIAAFVNGAEESTDALAFRYDRGRGEAHFKVPSGDRIDVSVRVVRVEPR